MKIHILTILLTLTLYSTNGQAVFALPTEWSKDFKIELYSNGGKNELDTKVTFGYAACRYVVTKDSQKKTSTFKMTDTERSEMLAKLHELKADKVRSEKAMGVKTKASNGFCFYEKNKMCAEDSAVSKISDEDITNFHLVYQYLISFATQKRM